jgi:two-component system CheB/CheR fusion protein
MATGDGGGTAVGASRVELDGARALVGIGASAGGLRALEQFLSAVKPGTGLTYLVVQHLAPEHASILPQILGSSSPLPVEAAEDGILPGPDRVYVIPPNTALVVRDGRLRLDPPEPRISRLPINALFNSLAHELGPRAAAVVMSGTGSDGATGLRAMKRSGGLVVVQSPGEAEYDAMPRAALATGDVDFVVPSAEMPALIARELERRTLAPPSAPAPEEDELAAIAREVRARTGRELSAYKESTLRRRIQRRMHALNITDLGDYLRRVEREPSEAESLVAEMQISVTRFFRDPEAFQALAGVAVPSLVERPADQAIRAWVPGCATGEEAYSIAITLREEARQRGLGAPLLQVFATDVDDAALDVGRRGLYPAAVAQDVPAELLAAYFVRVEDGYEIAKEVRDTVIFSVHDVLSNPPFGRLDLISCRNLLIYFHPAVQQRLLPLFHYALRPDGFLLLGSTEMVDERSDLLRPVDRKHRIYARLETERPLPVPLPVTSAVPMRRAATPALPRRSAEPSLAQAALLALLDAHGAALALADASGEGKYFAGPISRFVPTPTGQPSTNLLALAPPDLRVELGAALETAASQGGEVRRAATFPGDPARRGELLVRPVAGRADLHLILFREPPAREGPEAQAGDAAAALLQEELRYATDRWHRSSQEHDSTVEQLRSANEELQTMNEELQSTNEELQVSQEELQSVNEELHTVNAELNRKVEELNDLNADLRNLLQSTRIATLFLDRELRIARFTPAAAQLFPVTERDVGRPLADLTNAFGGELVETLVRAAMDAQRAEERVASLRDGSAHYLLRALPYQRINGATDGAVLTFVDVTELTRAQAALRESEERFRLLADGARDSAIIMLTPQGNVSTWNRGAERLEGWTAHDVVGRHFSFFYTPEDARAGKPVLLLERARAEGSIQDEGWRMRRDGSRFWASVVLAALFDDDGHLRGFGEIVRDITDRKRMEDELKEVDRRKNDFLGVLSHELRNPLAPIRNSLSVVTRAEPHGEQCQRSLAVADRQVRHMTRLIDDLLDVTRISHGKIRLQREQVEVTALARRTVEDFRQTFENAGVDLALAFPDTPVFVYADPARFCQMLGNLLHNAAKFTPRDGRTEVSLRVEGGQAVLTVTDSGEGIAPELMATLFEPFQQSQRAVDRSSGGLGLGLALVKSLAELHGGTVSAASRGASQGATFVVRLPLDRRRTLREVPAAPSAEVTPLRILIIDDNVDAALSLEELLAMDGHELARAYSGPEGIEKVRAFAPDLVLCDIGLPGMDGYEVAETLRSEPALEVGFLVALTGFAQPEDIERAHRAGFDLHLAKPPDLQLLWKALGERKVRGRVPPRAQGAGGDGPAVSGGEG